MTFQTVLDNLVYDAYYNDPANSSKKLQIEAALSFLYNGSSTVKAMLDQISLGQPLNIQYAFGKFEGVVGGFTLKLDLNNLDNLSYITPNGKAVAYELVPALAHELVHAIGNKSDDPQTAPDFAGSTVTVTNVIHDELGIPHRLSYAGAGYTPDIKAGMEYTGGQQIDTAILVIDNYDVNAHNHSAGSRDLFIGGENYATGNENNVIYSGDGDDFLYGNGGSDQLEGGTGNDFIDGGTGVDSAIYISSAATNLNVRAESANSTNPNTIELDAGAGDIDHIKNVERVELGGGNDTITITRNPNIPYPSNVMFDGTGGFDTLQYAGEQVVTSIRELSAASEAASQDISMELIGNIERIKGTAGNDKLNIGLLISTKVETIEAGAGDDTVWVFGSAIGAKPEIDLGVGDDILKNAPQGSIVYGGAGNDTFELSKNILIADADSSDKITFYGKYISGGVAWKGQESPWAKGLMGLRYGGNDQEELVIDAKGEDEAFIANDNYVDYLTIRVKVA